MTPFRRVAVVSEGIGGVESAGRFAAALLEGFRAHTEAFGVATADSSTLHPMVKHVASNRLFTSGALRNELVELAPQVIVYVPASSGTAFSFWRARMLKRYAPGARVAMVLLQQHHHTAAARLFVSGLGLDKVFVQSQAAVRYMEWLGQAAQFIPAGVDLDRYRPASPAMKQDLREKYGLPADDYLVMLGDGPNGMSLESLDSIRSAGTPVVLTGTGGDLERWQKLVEAGVSVVSPHLRDVHEVYQACDAYVAPNPGTPTAEDFPAGVLEAMACNLAVAAYPSGGLTQALAPGDGLAFADGDEALAAALRGLRGNPPATRVKALPYGWDSVAGRMLDVMEDRLYPEALSAAY